MSSKDWLNEHFKDPYVIKAQKEGYPSRATYKLLEMQARDKLIKPGMVVVDLGSAPGGWSMVARDLVGKKGRVIALDILEMEPVTGVEFIQGDFTEQVVLDKLLASLGGRQIDVVLSDMAPNMSGQKSVDQPKSLYLVELALDCALQVLRPGGAFLAKIFQGEGVDVLGQTVKQHFRHLKWRKPKASRPRSNELYILGADYLGIIDK